jgi:tetratricopeptide (TPR) repeat protein
LLAAAFLLGLCELFDADVWWHIRGGQWVLEHHRAPGLDPFSFGSADRVWVDLNWLFQVLVAWLYGHGGEAAVVLLAATAGALTLAIVGSARDRSWPLALGVLAWVPALVLMSSRFSPRPEGFTLLYLAAYLAVLWHARLRPTLLWLLPVVQVLWVNTHGVFVLGPMVFFFYSLERGLSWLSARDRGAGDRGAWKRECKHLVPAGVLVVLACLVNPYFTDGALYPLLLLPKATAAGNIYKEYIAELRSPREYALGARNGLGPIDPYTRALVFLLLVLPLTFVLPAAWDAWRRGPGGRRQTDRDAKGQAARGAGAWLAALAVGILLAMAAAAALPGRATARWLPLPQILVPLGFVLLGAVGGWRLRGRSTAAWLYAIAGGAFGAAWATWLRTYLLEFRPVGLLDFGTGLPSVLLVVAGVPLAAALAWRRGGLYRLLLTVAFSYLALTAYRNGSLFAIAGGAVIAWNLGEWASALAETEGPTRARLRAGWGLRLGVLALLTAWVVFLAADQYYPWVGQPRRLGLGERPFLFAHDAARFAGRPGLPDRALVFDYSQGAVYLFHNSPRCKPYLDARLEFPTLQTFERYVAIEHWLQRQDRKWVAAVHDLGDPLVMIIHAYHQQEYLGAEAALLGEPGWRCVYYDAVASLFVADSAAPSAGNAGADFAGRLFHASACRVAPDVPTANLREAWAMFGMAMALRRNHDGSHQRDAILLGVLGRTGLALEEDADTADAWAIRGDCHRQLFETPSPLSPDGEWDPARVVPWAQATFCYQRALDLAPDDTASLYLLYDSYRARRMADAQLAAWEQLRGLGWKGRDEEAAVGNLRKALDEVNRRFAGKERAPADAVVGCLDRHQPLAAMRRAEEADMEGPVSWPWPVADRLATAYLQLGRPAQARRVWERAPAPSTAARLCRLATTHWVERDFDVAVHLYHQALAKDPTSAEACWGLAMVHTQAGQAGRALAACRKALQLTVTQQERVGLQILQDLLPPYTTHTQ